MGHVSTEYLNYLRNAADRVRDLIFTTSIAKCTERSQVKVKRKVFNKIRNTARRVVK